jgi:hypothetical protein
MLHKELEIFFQFNGRGEGHPISKVRLPHFQKLQLEDSINSIVVEREANIKNLPP